MKYRNMKYRQKHQISRYRNVEISKCRNIEKWTSKYRNRNLEYWTTELSKRRNIETSTNFEISTYLVWNIEKSNKPVNAQCCRHSATDEIAHWTVFVERHLTKARVARREDISELVDSKYWNIDMTQYRNVENSMYRSIAISKNIETSKYQTIQSLEISQYLTMRNIEI